MRIGIRLAGVVAVGGYRLMGGEFFKPDIEVVVKAGLVVVDKNAGGYVHGIDETQPFLYARFRQQGLNLVCYIDKLPRLLGVKPQFLC